MTILKFIKTKSCPHCNAGVSSEKIDSSRHVNGTKNETREFECGFTLSYIKNYHNERGDQKEFPGGECSKSIDYGFKIQTRSDVVKAMLKAFNKNKNDSDTEFNERVKRELGYLTPYEHRPA